MIKVLLIDKALDQPFNVRRVLGSSHGFDVECATTYSQMLNGFRNNRYDVCVIDSPNHEGVSLYNQARSVGSSMPVVLVVSDDASEALNAMRWGVADCLVRNELTLARVTESICYVVERARGASLHAERERRYLALLDNSSVILYSHDLKGNFTSINRTGERMTGYSEAEILKRNVADLVVYEFQSALQDMIAQTLDARTQIAKHIELSTRYRTRLALQVTAHPIQRDGKTTEIQAIGRYTPSTDQPFYLVPNNQSIHLTETFIL